MKDNTHGDLDAILNSPDALIPGGEPLLVLATNWELLSVLDGSELVFLAEDGTRVRIRLYSTDELMAAQKAAAEALGGPDPGMTRKQAIELCQPLGELLRRKGRRRP